MKRLAIILLLFAVGTTCSAKKYRKYVIEYYNEHKNDTIVCKSIKQKHTDFMQNKTSILVRRMRYPHTMKKTMFYTSNLKTWYMVPFENKEEFEKYNGVITNTEFYEYSLKKGIIAK